MATEAEHEKQQEDAARFDEMRELLFENDECYHYLVLANSFPQTSSVKRLIEQAIMQIESDEMEGP